MNEKPVRTENASIFRLQTRVLASFCLLVLAVLLIYIWKNDTVSATPREYARMWYDANTATEIFDGTFEDYLETVFRDGGKYGSGPTYVIVILYSPSDKFFHIRSSPGKLYQFKVSRKGHPVSVLKMGISRDEWNRHKKIECSAGA